MKKIFTAIGFALLICGSGPAVTDEPPLADQFQIKAVSLAIKTCMKTYLANSDFPRLKKEKMAEIDRKTAPQFAADYNQAWAVLKKCPDIVSKYRLRQSMTKQEVLRIVGRLTKSDCIEAVDNIPDEVLVDQFNKCINGPEMQNKSLSEQIDLIIKRCFVGNGG